MIRNVISVWLTLCLLITAVILIFPVEAVYSEPAHRAAAHAEALNGEVVHGASVHTEAGKGTSAGSQSAGSQAGEVKILITADQVEFDPQNEIATYTGNVTVKQESATLYADRIEVHFIEKGKGIEVIRAFGNIRITQEDRILTAEEGTYYQQDRKVVLTGNPTTRQGGNCISGDKIVYFLKQGRATVEGNVKATVIMDKEKMDTLRPK